MRDKIKHYENLSDKQASTIRLDKKIVSLEDMRNEELTTQRVSKYKKDQIICQENVKKVQITIQAEIEHTLGN